MHLIERASEITIFKNMIQENNSAGASSYLLPISSVIKYESSEFKHTVYRVLMIMTFWVRAFQVFWGFNFQNWWGASCKFGSNKLYFKQDNLLLVLLHITHCFQSFCQFASDFSYFQSVYLLILTFWVISNFM